VDAPPPFTRNVERPGHEQLARFDRRPAERARAVAECGKCDTNARGASSVVLENAKATLRDHTPAATTSSPIGAYSTGLGDPEAIDENALQIAAAHRREAS